MEQTATVESLGREIRILSFLLIMLTVVLLVASGYLIHYVVNVSSSKIFQSYVSTSPHIFEVRCASNKRAELLSSLRKAHPVKLTANDLNCLIEGHPALRMQMRVQEILDGKLRFSVSLPFINNWRRYFLNGVGEGVLNIKQGLLDLKLQSLTVKGAELPQTYLNIVSKRNVVGSIYGCHRFNSAGDAALQRYLWKIDKLTMKDHLVSLSVAGEQPVQQQPSQRYCQGPSCLNQL